jgi:protein TonB
MMVPKPINEKPPAFPFGARESGINGAVELDVVIGRDGSVEDVTVLSGNPLLTPAAVEAVRKWQFQPPLINGSPIEVLTTVEVNFKFYRPLNL